MKVKTSFKLVAILIGLATTLIFTPSTIADVGGAHMQMPRIDMRPAPQGEMELIVTVGFTGGCCFPLTTYNIAASLMVPSGVTIRSGPEPRRYEKITGPPGGVKQGVARFRWRLKKENEEAVYPLKVSITTRNSGEVEKIYHLGRLDPCTIPPPLLPNPASHKEEIPVKVEVMSNREDRFVEEVTLYYLPHPSLEDMKGLRPQKGSVSYNIAGAGQITQKALSVKMVRRYEPTIWWGSVPPQPPGPLCYWIVAKDSEGEYTISAVYELEAVDFPKAHLVIYLTWGGLSLGVLIGLALIWGGGRPKTAICPGLLTIGRNTPLVESISWPKGTGAGIITGRWGKLAGLIWLVAGGITVALAIGSSHFEDLLSRWQGGGP